MADHSLTSRQLLDALTYQLLELGKASPAQLDAVRDALVDAERIIGSAAESVEPDTANRPEQEPTSPHSSARPSGQVPAVVFAAPTPAKSRSKRRAA
ncbi:MAG TPA: hypothetical protein VGH99_21530 [Pseudonocardia sp.]